MQHIGLKREHEDGSLLSIFDEGKSIDLRIFHHDISTTICLRFIDPYGDTIFNQLQLPVVIQEIEALKASTTDSEFSESVARVIEFLKDSEEVHVHVRFVGD
ncbi:MAG: hypothetical protein U1G05_05595 [Kiritimatiellia bacterium]